MSGVGGLAGVKRPAEEPIDRTSGRKNQAVTAKAFSSPKTDTDTKVTRSNGRSSYVLLDSDQYDLYDTFLLVCFAQSLPRFVIIQSVA